MTYASEAGHWYEPDGTPAYEVIGKNGEPRPTTLRDARKLGLLPSVSGIIDCASAQALESWKRNQLLMTAYDTARQDGETVEDYIRRVTIVRAEQAKIAPDTGTAIHGCIERCLGNQPYDQIYMPHVDGALATLAQWCDGLAGLKPEKSFAHRLGYGGKVDVHKEFFVADFKTKAFTSKALPATYDNHAMQLAAYREGLEMPFARCAIIYVSTEEPGLTHLVEIDEDELARGWNMFCSLLRYWQIKNRYEPETRKELHDAL